MATNITLLIDEAYLRNSFNIDSNTDSSHLKTAIWKASFNHLINIIGSGLYSELVSQVSNNTVTVLNQTLFDSYVKPALAFFAHYELYYALMVNVSNKGLTEQTSQNSNPADAKKVELLMSKLLNDATVQADRVTRYLVANEASYPLFLNPGNSADTIFPQDKNTGAVLYTPGRSSYYKYGFDKPSNN